MNRLFITGDIHGEAIERFSYKKHPEFRELDEQDVILIVGDCGLPFGVNLPSYDSKYKQKDKYELDWLSKRKETYLFLCGNHDDRSAIGEMPYVDKFNGQLRQVIFDGITYDNIFYIDFPQILDICGQHCLCIPGAKSHDIDVILDPEADNFEERYATLAHNPFTFFRIRDWTWWDNEDINIEETEYLVTHHAGERYDCIFTHDCPSIFLEKYDIGVGRVKPTAGEELLDMIRRTQIYDCWIHGHQHFDVINYVGNVTCLYKNIVEITEGE